MDGLTELRKWYPLGQWEPMFVEACHSGQAERAIALSTRSVSMPACEAVWLRALTGAVDKGHKSLAERLVSHMVAHKDAEKAYTLLYSLFANRCFLLAEKCIELGADPLHNPETSNGVTTLHAVALAGNLAWVTKMLDQYKCPVDARTRTDGTTPLQWAMVDDTDIEVVRVLLNAGANPSTCTSRGNRVSPVHAATLRGRVDILEALHAKGADLNAPYDPSGFPRVLSPLDLAFDAKAREWLLARGAKSWPEIGK